MKRAFAAFLGVAVLTVLAGTSYAKKNPDSLLSGSYAFQAVGTALVTPTNSTDYVPSSSEPEPILVTAAISGVLVFDGNGNITQSSQVALDIAGTPCPASAYQPSNGGTTSGTYTVNSHGPGTFAATGTLTLTPGGFNTGGAGTGPFCSQTKLNGISISLTGSVPQHSIAIGTFGGSGSTVGAAALPTSVTSGAVGGLSAAIPNWIWDVATHGEGSLQE